jgi:hypothetical protein
MSDYNLTGTYQLNKWLLSKLKDLQWVNDETGVTEKVFKAYSFASPGGVSITPFAQGGPLPALMNIAGAPPFIVFGYTTGAGVNWEITREQAAYVIWDSNTARLRRIQNYMKALLERFDWTAREVNAFLGVSPFDFKYVQVTTATSPDPALSEEGRQKGLLVAAFEYTLDRDQSGMRL